jgi:hypothetical protein
VASPETIADYTNLRSDRCSEYERAAALDYLPWRQLFRPFPLTLVGLAIMVALWGYGYKLSLYHPYPNPSSRASVAKLWDGPRHDSLHATCRLKTKSHLILGSPALWVPSQPLRLPIRAVTLVFPARIGGIRYSNRLIPSRSPPPIASA